MTGGFFSVLKNLNVAMESAEGSSRIHWESLSASFSPINPVSSGRSASSQFLVLTKHFLSDFFGWKQIQVLLKRVINNFFGWEQVQVLLKRVTGVSFGWR